jgi:hypothetical protein
LHPRALAWPNTTQFGRAERGFLHPDGDLAISHALFQIALDKKASIKNRDFLKFLPKGGDVFADSRSERK